MRQIVKDSKHLMVAAALFGVGVVLFLIARAFLVPEGFGELGHYRPGALDDNRARPPAFAGHVVCEECHSDAAEAKLAGSHRGVRCEACHGPLAAHASDPASVQPARPEPKGLCLKCHHANVAKPSGFPQVEPREHGGGESCGLCHVPHNPDMS